MDEPRRSDYERRLLWVSVEAHWSAAGGVVVSFLDIDGEVVDYAAFSSEVQAELAARSILDLLGEDHD